MAYPKPVPWTKPLFVHTKGSGNSMISYPSWDPNSPSNATEPGYVKVPKDENPLTLPVYRWKGSATSLAILTQRIKNTSTKQGWTQNKMFPFYVLSPETFGEDFEGIRFFCQNSKCMPYNPKSDYVDDVAFKTHKPNPRFDPETLTNCVMRCNQFVPSGGGAPLNLLSIVRSSLVDMNKQKPETSNTPPLAIVVVIAVLVISLGLLAYFAFRSK